MRERERDQEQSELLLLPPFQIHSLRDDNHTPLTDHVTIIGVMEKASKQP